MASSLPAAAAGEVLIGFAVALSGPSQPFDARQIVAAELAIDDVNARGGLLGEELRAVFADTGSRPDFAHRAVDELIDQGAALIVLTCDVDMRGTAAPRANERGIVAISPCAMVAGRTRAHVFSMATPPAAEAVALAAFAKERGWQRVQLTIDMSFVYNQVLCDRFAGEWQALGGEIAAVQFGDTRRRRLPSEVDAAAEALVLCAHGNGAVATIERLRADTAVPILAGAALDGDYWLARVPSLGDFFHTASGSIYGDDPRAGVNVFFSRLAERLGERAPNSLLLSGYSVIEAYAGAAERAGTLDAGAVLAELDRFMAEPLLIGPTSFGPERHLDEARPVVIIAVRDGKPEALGLYQSSGQ